VQDFPALRDRVDQRLPAHYPTLKRVVREIFALPSSPEIAAHLKRPLALGIYHRGAAGPGVIASIIGSVILLAGYRVIVGRRVT